VGEADSTNSKVQSLSTAAQKIGEAAELINDIASQTNLLALNATNKATRNVRTAQRPERKARDMAPQEQHRKQVLLIDNDRFSLSILKRRVDDLGYEPLIGSTAEAARILLETQTVKVIVFNQDLEAEWGLSLADQLRPTGASAGIPVILLSQASVRLSPRMENTEDDRVCFQKPIAIEPFVQHFRSLINDAVAPLR
jgi:PleD family two-component response regulator